MDSDTHRPEDATTPPASRGAALLDALRGFDTDFIEAVQDLRDESQPMQERDLPCVCGPASSV
jgi:hypothetical protein